MGLFWQSQKLTHCAILVYNQAMPIFSPNSLDVISRSPEQTRRIGMRLGAMLQAGDVVCLSGDLGAGKTTFIQGLSSGWGSLDAVSSPTFVLVNVYRRLDGQQLFHLDAYRLGGPADAYDLDLDGMLESGVVVVEWAERILQALPGDYLHLRLTYIEEYQRDLLLSAHGNGNRYQAVLVALRKEIFGG